MIVKDLDAVPVTDQRRKAGHDAETQFAFYLKRAFGSENRICILNGLRLEHGGDAAQVDHLIMHSHGLIIVESKSVFSTLKVNARGEWLRSYKGHLQGMPSAKLQADRQADFLRHYLDEHAKGLAKHKSFTAAPIDVLVAVSDGAVVYRPDNDPLDYLVKADAVPERVLHLIKARKPSGGLFGLLRNSFMLSDAELAGLAAFLLERHTPSHQTIPLARQAEPVTPPSALPPPEPPAPTTAYGCKTCQSGRLEVRWGKHNYYFKCLDCGGNTAIRRRCEGCGQEERVRKQGPEFFGECAPCGRSERFYMNA